MKKSDVPDFGPTDEIPNDNTYSTIIIHTTDFQNSTWNIQSRRKHRSTPMFVTFDHGTHIHILFSTANYHNNNRTVNRILSWFNATPAGIAESLTTLQRIRNLTKFIAYCVRFGLSTFFSFGDASTKFSNILKHFVFRSTKDITDAPNECSAYVEESKSSDFNSVDTYTTRSSTIDYILQPLEEYTMTSMEDFNRRIPNTIKIQLLKQIGIQYKSITQNLIKITNVQRAMQTKQTHYYSYLKSEMIKPLNHLTL
jgi:hypothetical protein